MSPRRHIRSSFSPIIAVVESNQTFTFICRRDGASSSYVDVQVMLAKDTRDHGLRLLADHQSASLVEIWCESHLVDRIKRSANARSGTSA